MQDGRAARYVCRPSVKKIRAVNDERREQPKQSARLVPKDCPSVKREKKNCFDAWAIICASRADFVFFFDTWV